MRIEIRNGSYAAMTDGNLLYFVARQIDGKYWFISAWRNLASAVEASKKLGDEGAVIPRSKAVFVF